MSIYYICFKLQKSKPVTNPQRKQRVFKQKKGFNLQHEEPCPNYKIILKIPFQRPRFPQFKALRFDPQQASTHTNNVPMVPATRKR